MLNARAKITLNATAEQVWAVVTDYAGYARFPGITSANLRTPGRTHPAGVGAIREVKAGAATFLEEIVEFDAPRRLVYKIIESRPIKIDHEFGCMQLTARGDQTDLEWESRGKVGVPLVGALLDYLMGFVLQRSFERVLSWIKEDLERTAAHSSAASQHEQA
jgi:uncharacterized protein YndB with AHSA1/START domain